jgi:mono/diheme cytochrome c family protein
MHYKIYILSILSLINLNILLAQNEWIVPDDKKGKLCDYEFNQSSISQGLEKYNANCISCHGNPSKNNYVNLTPTPGDPASENFQTNSDGELFHKIKEGNGQMPSFKNILSTEELWSVISYIRSFNKNYSQEISKQLTQKAYDGDITVLVELLDNNIIQSKVIGVKKSTSEPLENVSLKLMAKRAFGSIIIDEIKQTNKEGIALFNAPTNLPGDSIGSIDIIVQLTNDELYGIVKTDTALLIGKPTNNPSLVEERAMWNKMSKAPIWLLVTYGLGVIVAWSFILYILILIRKIYLLGKKDN